MGSLSANSHTTGYAGVNWSLNSMSERRRYNRSGLGKSMWKVCLVWCCLFPYRRRSTGLGEQRKDSFFLLNLFASTLYPQFTATRHWQVRLAQHSRQLRTFYHVVWLKCFSSGDWQVRSRPFFFCSSCQFAFFTLCHLWTWGVVDVYASPRMKTTTHLSSVSRPTSSKSQRTLLPVSHFNTFGETVLSPEYIRWSQNHCST